MLRLPSCAISFWYCSQNEIIFEAEKERNALELECDELKGLARLTKRGELQSKIDRKNEEIDILKIGLSGIVRRYGYQNVQESDWEKIYGYARSQKKESVYEFMRNFQQENSDRQSKQTLKSRGRGAR